MMRPCLKCGVPTPSSYCEDHDPGAWRDRRHQSATDRGYDAAWSRLSRRARRMQGFCSDCGSSDDLQLDHTPRTWARKAEGKVIRLKDTGGVVCGPCNRRRGAGRQRPEDQGTDPGGRPRGLRGKAETPSLSTSRDFGESR